MPEALLVLISGPPGAGKTTLGAKIAAALGVPFFNKDGIKETLFDTLGAQDRAWSRQLGIASSALLFHVMERQLATGQSLVAESAFQTVFDALRLRRLQERYRFQTLEVHCTAQIETLLERFAQRAQSAERHPGHGESSQMEELRANLERGVYAPLCAPDAALIIDTTEFAQIDHQRLMQRIRSKVGSDVSGENTL
ncbi:MAG TPA: AAA family ATPase [Ktedonobacterales bacterium]|nr:AAA family ATPase [Ktedonobacterales bacterium]